VAGVSGAAPGLYGGTRSNSSCDAPRMASYLSANAAKAAAWAAAEGINPGEISGYLAGLTPVVLRSDTRVTNHGYLNGRATPFQSILQAGTAVLVDQYGTPRARCGCGNPLTPPIPFQSGFSYTGPRWQYFNPTTVVVVSSSVTVINTFVLIDVNTGQTFARPVGTTGGSDANAPQTGTTPTSQPPNVGSVPATLQDVVGNYGNLKITTSGDCGGFQNNAGQTFRVTVADPARGVVSIATSTGDYSGTLNADYSFQFKDSTSTATLDGRFQQANGTITMSGSVPLGTCTISFTADRIG
jgi:hypothetical protein